MYDIFENTVSNNAFTTYNFQPVSGNGACVDNTPFMTPAQSVENFYQEELEEEDDEALSVAGTEYSEAPSVARSYTISQNSNQVKR